MDLAAVLRNRIVVIFRLTWESPGSHRGVTGESPGSHRDTRPLRVGDIDSKGDFATATGRRYSIGQGCGTVAAFHEENP